MLQDLIVRTRSEDTIGVDGIVVGFERIADAVTLRLLLTAPIEFWRVVCGRFEEFVIRPEPGSIAAFNATHATVRQYTDSRAELFFAGRVAAPGQTAERLRAVHQNIAGDWTPFERYLNDIFPADLLGRTGGKIPPAPFSLRWSSNVSCARQA